MSVRIRKGEVEKWMNFVRIVVAMKKMRNGMRWRLKEALSPTRGRTEATIWTEDAKGEGGIW